jgi:hypothetical protein
MISFYPSRVLLALVIALALSARVVSAASIGIDLTPGPGLAPKDSAGAPPFAQTHFNTVSHSTGNFLSDSNGNPTVCSFVGNLGSGFFTHLLDTPAGPDEMLNNTLILDNSDFSFALGFIPYSSYSIVIYDLSAAGMMQSISIGSTTFYTSSPNPTGPGYVDGNPATPFLYTLGSSTDSTAPTPNSDYVIFTGLSGSSQTVFMRGLTGGFRALSGLQIIDTSVPEPSTFALMGFGCFAALLFAWRSKIRPRPVKVTVSSRS